MRQGTDLNFELFFQKYSLYNYNLLNIKHEVMVDIMDILFRFHKNKSDMLQWITN